MQDILSRLYEMTAFGGISYKTIIMWFISFVLLYLGIKKKYEPLLLVPIAFGVLLANFPGGGMGIVPLLFTDKDRVFATDYFYGCWCLNRFWADA